MMPKMYTYIHIYIIWNVHLLIACFYVKVNVNVKYHSCMLQKLFKEITYFLQQRCIQLIKRDSKYIYISCFFKHPNDQFPQKCLKSITVFNTDVMKLE